MHLKIFYLCQKVLFFGLQIFFLEMYYGAGNKTKNPKTVESGKIKSFKLGFHIGHKKLKWAM